MKRIISLTLIAAVLLGSVIAIAEVAGRKQKPPAQMVRVAIVRDAREVNLEIQGSYHFIDLDLGRVVAKGPRLIKSKIRLLDKGLFVGMAVYPSKRVLIKPSKDASIIVNNHRFRGDILLLRTPDNRLTAINNIDIEDYIKGVLYHEISHHWPIEAIKAQAVATRTYAIYKMQSSQKRDYDVTNDIYSQVYGGKNSERYRTGIAVDRTTGEVLSYQGKILPAYFHATCAGMTEDSKELWNISIPPLKGVPCLFCQDSPHMRWKKNFRLQNIQEKLNKNNFLIGPIKNIEIIERTRSERVKSLKITGRDASEVIISAKDFREAIGPNELRSNNYEIAMQGYYVDFIGKGWGHGVGLCQWGARGMSAQQFNYKQILAYYYPSSTILDYHDLKSTSSLNTNKSPSR